jgi:hypothetical protein
LDDFDNGTYDPTIWSTVGSGSASTGNCGALNGYSLQFTGSYTRYAETNDLNLSQVQSIQFGIKIGNGGLCEDVDSGEDIVLEYSNDGGSTWTLIQTYYNYTNNVWTIITENLPLNAQTNATRLKWRQLSHSGSGLDEWSIDEVQLNSGSNISYLWSNGATSANVNNLAPGTYTVTVYDNASCQDTLTVVIPGASACNSTLTLTSTNESYNGAFNGTATASVSGGQAPYSYFWSNGQTTSSLTNLTAGSYFVYVTDVNGCTDTGSVQVFVCNLNLSLNSTDESSYQANDGTATATGTNQNGNLTYSWSTGDTTATIDSLTPNSYYYVTITDAAGCTDGGYVYINDFYCNLFATPIVINETSYQSNDGEISLNITGGSSPFTYLWSSGATTASIQNLSPGTYSVTITDSSNCPYTVTATVDSFICALDVEAYGFAASSPQYNDGSGLAIVTGTSQLDDFNGSVVNPNIWAYTVGTYLNTNCGSVSGNALHFQGNSSRYAETVNMNATGFQSIDFHIIIGDGSSSTCEDADSGEDVYLQYSTNNGGNWYNISTYYTHLYGNWTQISATIPSGAKTGSTKFRFIQNSHSGSCCDHWAIDDFAINGASGNNNYNLWWSNGDTTHNINNLVPGTYTVYVSDTFNCSDSASIIILPDTLCNLILSTYSTMETAVNAFDGTASVTSSNGVTPYIYQWSNGQTTSNINNLNGGSYTVYVTDAIGCTDTANVIVETCDLAVLMSSTDLTGNKYLVLNCQLILWYHSLSKYK